MTEEVVIGGKMITQITPAHGCWAWFKAGNDCFYAVPVHLWCLVDGEIKGFIPGLAGGGLIENHVAFDGYTTERPNAIRDRVAD